MDFRPEFPLPTPRENDAITDFFRKEEQYMAAANFYQNARNCQIRRNAIHVIATGSWGRNFDPFIPYMAMNYFDRFVSRFSVSDIAGDELQNIVVIAISCLTISFKMRRKAFDALTILHSRGVEITILKILVTELHILDGLEWRMRSITPFCFLDYFYPKFKKFGGFRRNSINEIIVQSQADYRFTRFKPSVIAFSSLMAAASILYPNQYPDILNEESARMSAETTECLNLMTEFCNNMNFRIEPAKSEEDASERTPPPAEPTSTGIPTETEEARNKGKGIMESSSEIPTETEEARNKGKGIMESSSEIPTETEEARNKGKGIMESSSEIPTETEKARNKEKGIMQSLGEILTETEEARNKGKGIMQSLSESSSVPTVPESEIMAADKEIVLGLLESREAGTSSAADELTNKLMTFKLRWIEIAGADLTIDPLPCQANAPADRPVKSGNKCGCCNIL